MLKITYTENGLYLERLNTSLETWLSRRILVSLRAGTSIYAEPSTASLLLPVGLPYFKDVKVLAEKNSNLLAVNVCDEYSVEAILEGTWVTTDNACDDGIFVCHLEEEVEFFLYQFWREDSFGTSDTSLIEE